MVLQIPSTNTEIWITIFPIPATIALAFITLLIIYKVESSISHSLLYLAKHLLQHTVACILQYQIYWLWNIQFNERSNCFMFCWCCSSTNCGGKKGAWNLSELSGMNNEQKHCFLVTQEMDHANSGYVQYCVCSNYTGKLNLYWIREIDL